MKSCRFQYFFTEFVNFETVFDGRLALQGTIPINAVINLGSSGWRTQMLHFLGGTASF